MNVLDAVVLSSRGQRLLRAVAFGAPVLFLAAVPASGGEFHPFLTVVGVLAMMLIISPVLAIVALIAIPLSLVVTTVIAKRSQPKFVAQWRSTGELNARVEETFTGHSLVKVFGRQADAEKAFDDGTLTVAAGSSSPWRKRPIS